MGAYSPFDNATLVFKVYSSFTTDTKTGNKVPVEVTETYTANVQLQLNKPDYKAGVDEQKMLCKGRLLSPTLFSTKIKPGSTAHCTINGLQGTLRLDNLGFNTLPFARNTLHQEFSGIFEQVGRGN